jgi:high affinity Mn2+ porin
MSFIDILDVGPVHPGVRAAWALALAAALVVPAAAEETAGRPQAGSGDGALQLPQPLSSQAEVEDSRRWLLGGQATATGVIVPGFRSPYRNPETSFGGPERNGGWSLVATILVGARLWDGALVVAQPEFADGAGVPNVAGVAGYIDGNIIRVAKVGKDPYFARLFFQQDIALGPVEAGEAGVPEDHFMPTGPFALRRTRPESRIEMTAGKFATTDFFDVASATSDPRHHFLNWSLMTNGAWDFAADTRGYTWGLVVALEQPRWALRAGAAMMPTTANGPVLDGDLAHARSEMIEGEIRYQVLGNAGALKLLGCANHARMGSFADALGAAALGHAPDINTVVRRGAVKYGVGVLIDQRVGPAATFLRASWNDGRTEEFAFTQIERAISAGAEIPTDGWGRAGDHLGVGLALNGLSPEHVRYLQAGGVDFQLGDGRLRYAWESVLEAYYALHLGRNVEFTGDVQRIANPGMNADRGPAVVFGLRLHAHI